MKLKKIASVLLALIMAGTVTLMPMNADVLSIRNTNSVYAAEDSGVGGFVNRLYELTLGRKADQAGFDDWVNKLETGKSDGGKCAYGFFFSKEYLAKNTSNEEYVETLYRVFFDRESDAAGKADWVGKLNKGNTRLSVFYGFVNSNEWANLCAKFGIASGGTGTTGDVSSANIEGITTFVLSLYRDCLGREADKSGLDDWVNKLASGKITGKEAAYGFFFSKEFLSKNLNIWDEESVKEYIALYYRVFLDREPDDKGLEYWVGRVNKSNYINLILFEGFSDSLEFATKCKANGIVAGSHIEVCGTKSEFTDWAMSFATNGKKWNSLLEYVNSINDANDMAPHFPYVFGGLSPETGIDCSGLIVYYIRTFWGVNNVPHHMLTMAKSYGTTINPTDIKPGDLICDGSGYHGWVYLYVGRVGPDYRGEYHDYMIGGRATDYDTNSEYGYNSWSPVIYELSYADEELIAACTSIPMLVQEWVSKNPSEYRVARVVG